MSAVRPTPFVPRPVAPPLLNILGETYYRKGLVLAAHVAGFAAAARFLRDYGDFLCERTPLFQAALAPTVARSLSLAQDDPRVAAVVRGYAQNFRLALLESEFIERKLRPTNWQKHVRLVGFEPVLDAARRRRGVMLAGTYFGSHQVATTALALAAPPRSVAAIVSPMQFSTQRRWMRQMVRRRLLTLYPIGQAVVGAVQALRAGQIVVMISEHARYARGGVEVEFLGTRQVFHPTPALLSWRTDCPIAVAATVRLDDRYHFETRVYDWIEPPHRGRRAWVEETTRRIIRTLERVIRTHPEQFAWLWTHFFVGQAARRSTAPHRRRQPGIS